MSSLTRWRPFEPLSWSPLAREMSDLWRRWFETDSDTEWAPRSDFVETPESYIVKVETPGMKAEDVQITLSENLLTLKGEKRQEAKREQDNWHVVERRHGTFQRSFTLPGPVHPDTVEATMRNGVLEVRLMKSEESRTKKIEVKSE